MSTQTVARREPWLRSMVDFYLTAMRTQIQTQFQYRVPMYMYTLGMAAEPTIYLVVWTTIARSHGGAIDGARGLEKLLLDAVEDVRVAPELRFRLAEHRPDLARALLDGEGAESHL